MSGAASEPGPSGSRVPIGMYTLIFIEKIAPEKNDAMMRDLCFIAYGCTAEGSGRSLFSTRNVQSCASALK